MKTRLFAGPLTTEMLKASSATTSSRPGDDRDAEGEQCDDEQPAPVRPGDRAEDGLGAGGRCLDPREAVRLDDPAEEHGEEDERHYGEREHPAKAQRLLGEAVDDRRQTGTHGVARGHEGHRLRPLVRRGELHSAHLGQPYARAQEGPAEGEDRDEPPVGGAQGRKRG